MEILQVEQQGLLGGPGGTEVQAVWRGLLSLRLPEELRGWLTRPSCPGRRLVLAMIPLAGKLRSPGHCPSVTPKTLEACLTPTACWPDWQ